MHWSVLRLLVGIRLREEEGPQPTLAQVHAKLNVEKKREEQEEEEEVVVVDDYYVYEEEQGENG